MDKVQRMKEVRRQLTERIPTLDEISELIQEIITDRLYEGEGYTTFAKFVDGWPELRKSIQTFRAVTHVRRLATVALYQAGQTQQQVAKTVGVGQNTVKNDLKAAGVQKTTSRGRPRKAAELTRRVNSGSESEPVVESKPAVESKPMLTSHEIQQKHESDEIMQVRTSIDLTRKHALNMFGVAQMLMPAQIAVFQMGDIGRVLDGILEHVQKTKEILTQQLPDWDKELKNLTEE